MYSSVLIISQYHCIIQTKKKKHQNLMVILPPVAKIFRELFVYCNSCDNRLIEFSYHIYESATPSSPGLTIFSAFSLTLSFYFFLFPLLSSANQVKTSTNFHTFVICICSSVKCALPNEWILCRHLFYWLFIWFVLVVFYCVV